MIKFNAALRIVPNRVAIGDSLKGDEVQAELAARAEAIASAAGEGMEVESTVGPVRARSVVRTATTEARIAEATHRVLTRSIDAGR